MEYVGIVIWFEGPLSKEVFVAWFHWLRCCLRECAKAENANTNIRRLLSSVQATGRYNIYDLQRPQVERVHLFLRDWRSKLMSL